jgi:two-component system NtrC family sensor kinase
MRLNLISKLTLATGIILVVTMACFAWLNIGNLKRLLLEESVTNVENLSETIVRTTYYQMLDNDLPRVFQMITEAGSQKGVERIRLISKDGKIAFSTKKDEIGTLVDKKAAACNMCHTGSEPLLHTSSMNRSRIFNDERGKEVLGMAKGIYNEPKCSAGACHFHHPTARILGVLDVIVSLDNMNAQLAEYRNKTILHTIILLGLLAASITFFMMNLVTVPLSHLLTRTKKIAEGDLESSVAVQSGDELGELAQSFNIMTDNLRQARWELEEWAHNLETKVEDRTHELKQMQAQLIRSEKLASQGELVAGIAHEINNPLTGILVYSSLISSDPKLDPDLKPDLETIVRETQRCASIVKGLLDFSRETPPRKNPLALEQVLEEALNLVVHQSLFHNIVITKRYAAALPQVMADHNQIEQVFINLLLNAGQAMTGAGDLTITTGLIPGDNSVFAAIRDTGCGITEEHLVKIFDPFFTTKDQKGTGLGLSVSFGIIANHGGRIGVESVVGTGTTFTIILPLTGEDEEHEGVGGD